MHTMVTVIVRLIITVFISLILTPLVKLLAFRIGAVDVPGPRRINKKIMPTMGGLAIFCAFAFSTLILFDDLIPKSKLLPLLLGALIIVITGIIDDVKELSPLKKMAGILIAACEIYFVAGVHFDSITLPIVGFLDLRFLSFPLTILWIVAITNSLNFIDGLDGLASGVSIIALFTIGVIGYFFLTAANFYVAIIIFVLIAAIIGFFPYNFHPAKIYLGDTGALFLGFMISVLSLQGLKNATIISLITPMLIMGVPITDTVYAIIRRFLSNRPIYSADKMHLHHRLISLGFTHKGAVLTIYGLALIFSFVALILSYNHSVWSTVLLFVLVLVGLELFVELIGLMGPNRQPLMYVFKVFGNKEFREEQKKRWLKKK
ncbi:UDP-GlcNAc:undecaprenyl-phosphate GlcNAc-1-phosphate transferase [Enterococcus sp. PF1-24]|uniref:glycosyltransferase family 4 protein n=1 Tax=unclassified Enterococcus TaxID=2608891 RepID=UPI002474B3FF|nr:MULTISPECIES: MraY family glycosyltransferase [unclassified Enterococcus]MDH6364550.1 UDP-GlcNAc:undecaprenyl-phosphate GlcNAc-1-phosphate transferase [Enterococcus sp. PFB1-1]MDH6401651.1 UDP-GlcNAc:undecaprenyl-phosphate GlcNAc-1-phosphate transferase [Enterococcus sp. PF1-24]